MGTDHKCPEDPFREAFHAMVDDGEGPYDAGCWGLNCCPSVEFHWDQWMVCRIKCLHGTVRGVACGINFVESFTHAVKKFNAFDHSQPHGTKGEHETWGSFFDRCEKRPYSAVGVSDTEENK